MESEFPSNSRSNINKKSAGSKSDESDKKIEKVITGVAVQRKRSLGKRFKDTFFSGADSKSVLEYVFVDILLPYSKDMVADATQAGIERKLWGETRSAGRRGGGRGGGNYTAYNRIGNGPAQGSRQGGRDDSRSGSLSRRSRENHNFEDIVLGSRVEGINVIDSLFELLSKYDVVTVADLYSLVDIEATYTDRNWGWTDLRGADVMRVSGGYLLDLPRPEPID